MEQMKLKTPDIRKTECVTILTLQQKLKLMTEITFVVIGGNLLSLTLAIFVYTLLAPSYGESLKAMAAFAAIVTATLPILAVNYRCRIVPKYGMAAFYSIVCASASVFFFWAAAEHGTTKLLYGAGIALCIYLVTAYIGIRWKFRLIVNVNSKSLAGAIYFVAIFIVLGEFMVDMLILQQPTSMIFTHSCLVFLFALANIMEYHNIMLELEKGNTKKNFKMLKLSVMPSLFINLLGLNVWVNVFKIIYKYIFMDGFETQAFSLRKIYHELSK